MCGRCALFTLLVSLLVVTSASAATTRRSAAAKPSTAAASPPQSQADVAHVVDQIVDRVWERGDYYWHNGRYTDRIATDKLVIQMDPTFAEAYSTAGFLLENTGKEAEALAMYQRA